ncbi:MAG: hypothetical protein LW823_01800 [Rickettsiales bacterium]|jgi:hypothetical protein|nr:hypothetical protein [Rickettsiales bacterium]
MSSKNNPEARGKVTELRKYNGKSVKPVLYIQRGVGRYIAAAFEDGNLVIDKNTKLPIAYKNI